MKYLTDLLKGKKITVMGLGLLGRGVGDIKFLSKYVEEIIVTDLKTKKDLRESLEKLKGLKNIKYSLGGHNLKDFENRDFILKGAGVPLNSTYISHAQKNKIPVYMSTALFAKFCPAKIIGITGTRGKTTVTQMVFEILKDHYKRGTVFLGGNIQGMSTLSLLPKIKEKDIVVLELDSWQLQGFGDLKISPQTAVFTTFMSDHLNYYQGDLLRYFQDKELIYKNQGSKDIFFAGEQLCQLPLLFRKRLPKQTKFISENSLPKKVKLKVPGGHNRYNAALAFAVGKTQKISEKNIITSLEKFKGVEGRLQKIMSIKGVDIFNDTTATTPEALNTAIEALSSSKREIILLMGGADKGIDLSILKKPLNDFCSKVYLLNGSGTERLLKEGIIKEEKIAGVFNSLEKAVKSVFSDIKKGDIFLFSPGFASFGMFKNEYDRGDQFNSVVKSL